MAKHISLCLLVACTIILCSQIIISVSLPPFRSIGDLPYQAHSFNDVAYIQQLLKRGVKTFKIDVSMANYQSCSKNSNWNSTQKCYKTDQYAQQYCCLALRGDASGRNNFEFKFSTIDDFINMLDQYLTKNPIEKGIMLFAINHQFDFQFANQLVQNSNFKLAKLMEKNPKLYFAFGDDNFIFEYDRICRAALSTNEQFFEQPLKKLNAEACTAQRKFISSSRFILQSGSDNPSDPRDYHSRYRNFNVFYEAIVERCSKGFPSWTKKYPQFPLIFWQPSNQRQIQLVIQAFMSENCRLLHGRGIQGLAITSNIDPEVFEFYVKRVNQSLPSWPMTFMPDSQKVPLQFQSNFLTKMFYNNTNYLILGQQNPNQNSTKRINLQLIQFQIDSKGQKVSQKLRKKLPASKQTIKIVGGTNNFAVIQNNPYSPSQDTTIIASLYNSTFQKQASVQIQSYVDIINFRGIYYILRRTSNPLVFNVIKTQNFDKNSVIMSFSLLSDKAKTVNSFLAFQDSNQTLRYLLSGTIDNNVWVAEVRNQSVYKSGNIAFGQNSKLVLKQSGLIALSMQNGACNSAVLVNNGDTPLCSYYKIPQFKKMTSIKGTITIIQFKYENLIDYLQKNSQQPVTPCTPKFVHYKALNGKNINIVDIWSRMFISTQYVHISKQGLLSSLFCAASNYNQLKNDKKGMLGTIWSRNNVGTIHNQKQNILQM